jgi:molybdopterin-guanine dinucleotide biosynthesis protein A
VKGAEGRSLIVFAGGQATRLGGVNKALLEVGGKPIIQRILDAVDPLVSERFALARREAEPLGYGLRMVTDPEPNAGVLRALANGLAAASRDVCLVVACDMPFVSRLVFERALRLLEDDSVHLVIPRDAHGVQPMHAVYRREPVLAAVRQAISRGDYRMNSYFDAVQVRQIEVDEIRCMDPDLRAFTNVNTPEDLELAQRRATQG